jgi:chemotaxis protein methyltransferase CheR
MTKVLSLKPSYYDALKRLTLEMAGINLGANHEFLIETRLSALARSEGYDDMSVMIDELFASGQTRLAIHVISALLERDNSFFHERVSLEDVMQHCIPTLHQLYKGTKLRILCYGCSSGQEPYSLAMELDRNKDLFPGLDFEITGVDYPSVAIDRARTGRFTHFDVQRGLPIKYLITYFDRIGEDWQIKDNIREKVQFTDFYLLSKLESLGQFHLVLFRNRLARYSGPAQIRVLRELATVIKELGFLAMGRNESIAKLDFGLDAHPEIPSIMRKREILEEVTADPSVKVPNGRTTFEGAKNRLRKLKTEHGEDTGLNADGGSKTAVPHFDETA